MPLGRAGRRGGRWVVLGILGAIALGWAAGDKPGADPVAERFAPSPAIGDGKTAAVVPESDTPIGGIRAAVAPPQDRADASCDGGPRVALKPVAREPVSAALDLPIARALRAIDECQARYEKVHDYVCTFTKRERIDGHLTTPHVMAMKARTRPRSVYLKFRQPAAGREAIFIEGRHNGKVLAHDVGLGRLIAGTLHLDPTGARAMADCRHPITEAGIGPLLDTLEARWTAELDESESQVGFLEDQLVGSRRCTRIDVTHTRRNPDFMFYQVHLYIDRELGLPVRFEAFDWPASSASPADLVEEYEYTDLKLNVGLSDLDFDASNADYAFGRF